MKKLYSYLFLAVAFVLAAACSKPEQDAFDAAEMVDVNFTIQAENVATRAISDGTKADQLYYVIFKGDEAGTKTTVEATLDNVTFPYTLTLRLAKGNDYTAFFFAQNTELQAYTITTADGCSAILEADYSKMATDDDDADAFYNYHEFSVTGTISENVTLYRAVAQVNVGTLDFTEFNATASSPIANVVTRFEDLATKVQLLDGTVLESTDAFTTFIPVDTPMAEESLTVSETEYEWVSMNYVLAPKAANALINAQYILNAQDQSQVTTISVSNVPVQMNYRTNILGQLLTGEVEFNIVIDENFNTPDFVVNY